jgi:Raf kinase inhibitor-like YbhB/YbcL family protein
MKHLLKLGFFILSLGTEFIINVLAAQSSEGMTLSSPSFQKNASIPTQYTVQATNISPPLAWRNIPKGTISLALVCADPDAPNGNWIHWVLFNIPSTFDYIEEGEGNLASQVRVGKNSQGNLTYYGPNPPSGMHHYHFKLYALDKVLDLKAGATEDELQKSMKGHILEEATLVGLYQKK